MNNWHQVWSNKTAKVDETAELLPQLIKLNGFDTGFGSITPKQCKLMTKRLSEISKLCSNSDVFEIGCGAGALLHSIKLHTGCKISGIDYSQYLLKLQNTT